MAAEPPNPPSTGERAFVAQLVDAGLILEAGVPGIYGHDDRFERVRVGLERLLTAEALADGAQQLRFPPLLPRRELERTGYLSSFPHLAGSVYALDPDEQQAAGNAGRGHSHEDWSAFEQATDLALVPAACYPVYPAIAARGRLRQGGLLVEAGGAWVFRHEPSEDPARRQMFRQHELVRLGEPDVVLGWRDAWAERALGLLRELGLEPELRTAHDHFYGRRGRMLAAQQREQRLKLELLVPIAAAEPTALASFNYHRDHFGQTYGIELWDGNPAHTACLGFGHERIVLALLRTHGLDPSQWPAATRERLWPDGTA